MGIEVPERVSSILGRDGFYDTQLDDLPSPGKEQARLHLLYASHDQLFAGWIVNELTTANLGVKPYPEISIHAQGVPSLANDMKKLMLVFSREIQAEPWFDHLAHNLSLRQRGTVVLLHIDESTIPVSLEKHEIAKFSISRSSGLLQLGDALSHILFSEEPAAEESLHIGPKADHDSINYKRLQGHFTVIFRTSGERIGVKLALDMKCENAARHIIETSFLQDLPPERRRAYLASGEYYIAKAEDEQRIKDSDLYTEAEDGKPFCRHRSLQDAAFMPGDEIIIMTRAPFPWAHDPQMVLFRIETDRRMFSLYPWYRFAKYANEMVVDRLIDRGIATWRMP